MPIDPSIALSYKPVGLDIAGAMQAAEERKLLQSRNALAGAQQAAAQNELNNALAARRYAAGTDLNDPQNAMRLFGYGQAGADMFQSLQAGRASSAAARKSQLEASGVKAGQYRQALAFVNNPKDAMEWLQAHHDDPDMADSPVARMPLDVALSRIPQDPAGFQKWKEAAALGIDKYIERTTLTASEQSMAADRAAVRSETGRHNKAMEGIAQQRVSRTPTVGQTERAKIDAKFAAAAPQAIQDAENAIKLIDQMVGTGKKGSKPHPGFSWAVGAGIGTRFIPGTDSASFEAMHNQLMGGAFLQAYETLRGGGQITEIEGQKATAARNRMNLAQSETEYIKAAREYQDVLKSVIARAKQRMGSATDVTDVGSDSDWTDL